MAQAIIFDFDGVLADSEVIANAVLAEVVTDLGVPTTLDDALETYLGKRFEEVMLAISAAIGRDPPSGFEARFQSLTLKRFETDLRLIDGARTYIEAFQEIPQCIASSSSPDRLEHCLKLLGLTELFPARVFSASAVPRGKPHPDIFLYAAERVGVKPADCIIIEDSVSGVRAGVAAGGAVIGLLAASHLRTGHAARLSAAGAHAIAQTFAEAEEITRRLLRG